MVKRKIARVWQLDVENIGKGRVLGDILVNDDAVNQNREVRKRCLNTKMMNSALRHVEFEGLGGHESRGTF